MKEDNPEHRTGTPPYSHDQPDSDAPTDKQLRQLNWPALAFPWIWCFAHGLYLLGAVSIIPIVRLFTGFYLLFNGNRLDWEKNRQGGTGRYFRSRRR